MMDLKTAVQKRFFPIPDYYLPNKSSGIRINRSFESLTLIGKEKLIVANEEAMQQDGLIATINNGSPSRIITIDIKSGIASAEHIYVTEKVAAHPIPADTFASNGLVELLAMPDGQSMIALERSYSVGQGNVIRIFKTQFAGATNVLGRPKLGSAYKPTRLRTILSHLPAVLFIYCSENSKEIIHGAQYGAISKRAQ